MSKRAEAAALKAYPVKMFTLHNQDLIELFRKTEIENNEYPRSLFQEGYEQAEKDFALTWEDMAKIDAIIISTNNEFATDVSKKISRQTFYEEVLKRFNELKK